MLLASLWTLQIIHVRSAPAKTLNRPPSQGAYHVKSAPIGALNRTSPKPVRFACKGSCNFFW
ncbi:hypothetical protein XAC3810_430222 [Xanthomonas citri pv. citri]|uniref:Uncharacterized protein n=1 Tax=Xanthomonas citri pv. citri TaxID=611301 RepID=A0A0U5BTV1_XANCI|nr:Hypothetical Protein XCAW_02112 [Xanthomonas citri subsp. citri Aw12879]CEE28152.1 hypothetical protein XAC9322_450005 [Xanthomonas citri pv. citri]CEE28164.1 hypothetical protein XAC3824_560004 [Xanthomonas citri pv. citri]CEE29742.1 hypothetical protein XAC1083_440019 [Xanthomonas citri pv. citri]CEE38810.1 hypothetical protein XAC3810_430222 [Xanthomonas citri pv. citri]